MWARFCRIRLKCFSGHFSFISKSYQLCNFAINCHKCTMHFTLYWPLSTLGLQIKNTENNSIFRPAPTLKARYTGFSWRRASKFASWTLGFVVFFWKKPIYIAFSHTQPQSSRLTLWAWFLLHISGNTKQSTALHQAFSSITYKV